ncbi:MAG: helix-turn-helix domain-containing protein [Phycisphaerales bacterium]|nr:helix-turn-helix domain-containing protein [Phycisphaerales bacterium]
MAEKFYTLQESLSKLGCSEEKLREMVRSGRLREFRDAGTLKYRQEEVDSLVGSSDTSLMGSGELSLEDSGELAFSSEDSAAADAPKLEDSGLGAAGHSDPGASDSGILSLEDTGVAGGGLDLEDSGSGALKVSDSRAGSGGLSLDDSGSGSGELTLEDTGTSAGEVKLEDSGTGSGLTLEDSSGGSGAGADVLSLDEVDKDAAGGLKKDDTVITNIGISVFDEDDLEIAAADPMAKTLLTSGEDLAMDGSAAGSGLLDLTRESDDTSLGAELLEGIDMGDTQETFTPADDEESAGGEGPTVGVAETEAPLAAAATMVVPVAGMPPEVSPAYTGLLVAATLCLVLMLALTMATTVDVWPAHLAVLAQQFWIVLGSTVIGGGLCALIGWGIGKQMSAVKMPKPPKAEKKAKPKKEKKGKKGSS